MCSSDDDDGASTDDDMPSLGGDETLSDRSVRYSRTERRARARARETRPPVLNAPVGKDGSPLRRDQAVTLKTRTDQTCDVALLKAPAGFQELLKLL